MFPNIVNYDKHKETNRKYTHIFLFYFLTSLGDQMRQVTNLSNIFPVASPIQCTGTEGSSEW